MNKEKEIKEMASSLYHVKSLYDDSLMVDAAEALYKAGYRKIVHCCDCKYCEVVINEITDLPKYFCTRMVGCLEVDSNEFCSKAKMKGGDG